MSRSSIMFILLEGRVEDLQAQNPDINVKKLADSDPSQTKKYLPWMVKQVSLGAKEEDLTPTIRAFDRNIQKFSKRDINQYKTLKELEDEVKEISSRVSVSQQKQEAKSGATKLFEDDRFLLLRIDDKSASTHYGKGTKWCITMRDAQYFEEYSSSNVLFYFMIDKSAKPQSKMSKVADAVIRNSSNVIKKHEFYDAEDKKRQKLSVFKIFPQKFFQMIVSDAQKQPKSFLAKLASGERVDDAELEKNWKSSSFEQKMLIGAKIENQQVFFSLLKIERDPEMIEMLEAAVDGSGRFGGDYFAFENKNGYLHREGDKPADIYADGSKFWYKNGKRHRDGDQPAEVYADGTKRWYKNGYLHREGDKPAEIYANGSKFWYKNGKRHRDGDQPAEIWADGTKRWYKNGKRIRSSVD